MMWGDGFGWSGLGGFGWVGMLLSSVMMLVFWGGLIALGFFAVRALARSGSGQAGAAGYGGSRAMDVLKDRYARGEITKEQYEVMRRDIGLQG
jgi:putative membrane protein